jgi:hypothetical protein
MGQEVVAHVYDVANAATDNTVLHINRFFKDAIGLGGIFHTAIQVNRHPLPPNPFPPSHSFPTKQRLDLDASVYGGAC